MTRRAHGLGMSVRGRDPRWNVYLLDGTLQNDFTNGPAGSAAGTTLGMETVREFHVETTAYQLIAVPALPTTRRPWPHSGASGRP